MQLKALINNYLLNRLFAGDCSNRKRLLALRNKAVAPLLQLFYCIFLQFAFGVASGLLSLTLSGVILQLAFPCFFTLADKNACNSEIAVFH